MIFFQIFVYFYWIVLILARPNRNINQNRSQEPSIMSTVNLLQTTTATTLIKTTDHQENSSQFDLNFYRSSWKFIDKNTIRVRFRLHEKFLLSTKSVRFLVRHISSGQLRIYGEAHEFLNSTLSIYLEHLKLGRHAVCLLLYSSALQLEPEHIFCQDIIFNFHKYGHHDTETDDAGNTFFFLLTQYGIVCGILCTLQIVHAARKRRFLRTLYKKANSLRQTMFEYHHRLSDSKASNDLSQQNCTINYLIYNLDRSALYDFNPIYMKSNDEDEEDSHEMKELGPNSNLRLRLPNRLKMHRGSSLEETTDQSKLLDQSFDNNRQGSEEPTVSFRCLSHILEENKPWISRLTDDGSVKNSLLSPNQPFRSSKQIEHL